jgi:hypothetical protein
LADLKHRKEAKWHLFVQVACAVIIIPAQAAAELDHPWDILPAIKVAVVDQAWS